MGLLNGDIPLGANPQQPQQPPQVPAPTASATPVMQAPGVGEDHGTPEKKTLLDRLMVNTLNMIHSDAPRDKILSGIDPAKPVSSVAFLADRVLSASKDATVKKGGVPVTPGMVSKAANLAVGEIANLAEAAGLVKLTPEQKQDALKRVIGGQLKRDVKGGALDRTAYREFLRGNGVDDVVNALKSGKKLSPEQESRIKKVALMEGV